MPHAVPKGHAARLTLDTTAKVCREGSETTDRAILAEAILITWVDPAFDADDVVYLEHLTADAAQDKTTATPLRPASDTGTRLWPVDGRPCALSADPGHDVQVQFVGVR